MVALLGRRHPLLDVQGLRFSAGEGCPPPPDGLDVDVDFISLWHTGSDVSRMEMEADPGAAGRASSQPREHQLDIPLVCPEPGRAPHRRVRPLRRAEEMGGHLLPEGLGHGGHRAHHRLAARAHHRRRRVPAPDTGVPQLLRQDRHEHGGHPAAVHRHGLPGDRHLRRRHPPAAALPAQEARYI